MQSAERKLSPGLHEDPSFQRDYLGMYSKEKAFFSGARHHRTSSCDQHQNNLSLTVSLNEVDLSGWKKELHSLSQTQRQRVARKGLQCAHIRTEQNHSPAETQESKSEQAS